MSHYHLDHVINTYFHACKDPCFALVRYITWLLNVLLDAFFHLWECYLDRSSFLILLGQKGNVFVYLLQWSLKYEICLKKRRVKWKGLLIKEYHVLQCTDLNLCNTIYL